MFKLNLKIAIRNLLKNKGYTTFNIFGLAIGLAGFIIILLYINKETSYNKWDISLDRTYIAAADFTKNGAQNKGIKIKGLFSKVVSEQFNEVEAVSIGNMISYNVPFKTDPKADGTITKIASVSMDSNFFKVYPLKASYGGMDAIYKGKNVIAISKTTALQLFNTDNVVNKILILKGSLNFPDVPYTIKAVWDDQKQPSSFKFDVIFPEDLALYGAELPSRTFSTLFTLNKNSDPPATLKKINEAYIIELAKFNSGNSAANYKPSLKEALQILKDKEGITAIKLITEPLSTLNLSNFYSTAAKQTTIYILISLASFLIIISCINYTNLVLVMAQSRAKEVGVKKVLGALKVNLIKQFFIETAMQCIAAYLTSLILAELILPQVNQLLDQELQLFRSVQIWEVLGEALLVLIIVMLIAGIYPAIVLSGYKPAKVLKGNFSTAFHVIGLRKALVVLQFTIAIGLVISFGVMYAQLQYMKQKDLGIELNQLMTLSVGKYNNRVLNPTRFQHIKDQLLQIKGVEGVTRATEQPINDSGFENDISFGNVDLSVESRYIDPNYFVVVGGEIAMGRDFSDKLLATDSVNSVILNETAFLQLGLKKGISNQVFLDRKGSSQHLNVIGVVKDIQAYGFESAIRPTIYSVSKYPTYWRRTIILRLSTNDISKTVESIKTTWKEIEPGVEPNYTFVDDVFAGMNKSYETSESIISAFGIITLLISVFGLIGFAAYNAKMRLREIAIRRILGATAFSLMKLLNVDFVKLVIIATLMADIVAFIYMKKWFASFVYRIDMPVYVFVFVNVGILLLTITTVSWQSLHAVKANPVDALKYE
ncbi:MAG: ABC transporter permease [Bacteroidota bacterium]